MADPLLTVLNFSGGKQSSALLWMVLRGDIEQPENFVVLNANPGMENHLTYEYVNKMKQLCADKDIYFETVSGPNLYKDLTNLVTINVKGTPLTIDNPPYWTKSTKKGKGKVGRLMQKCTRHYKVRPMDRAVRRLLTARHGFSLDTRRLPRGCVEKWIGFALDEKSRVTNPDPRQKHIVYRYPLIEMSYTKECVENYFLENNLPIPPRSVCNACFANGLNTLKEMYYNRPEDWKQAVEVDNKIRNLQAYGVTKEVYVSKTLVPLEDLPKFDFDALLIKKYIDGDFDPDQETVFISDKIDSTDDDDWSCDSGYCFT